MFLHHHAALGTFLVAHPPAYLVNQRAVDFLAERVGFEPTCMHYIRKKINAFSAPHVKPCMSLVILSKKCTTSGYKINFSVKKTKRTPVDLLTTDEFGYPTMTVAGKLSPGHPHGFDYLGVGRVSRVFGVRRPPKAWDDMASLEIVDS